MKDTREQNAPPAVPAKAPQGGEIRARWEWAEDGVWTERMLETLETGIKGGRWFRLIDSRAKRDSRPIFPPEKMPATSMRSARSNEPGKACDPTAAVPAWMASACGASGKTAKVGCPSAGSGP